MAFCSNCGNQLEGTERFCSNCGNDVSSKAGTPAAAPFAAANGGGGQAVASPPMNAVQPVVSMPGVYTAPGAIPMAVAMPPIAPKKKRVTFGTLVIAAAIVAGGYYYYTHNYLANHPPASAQTEKGAGAALGKQQAFDAHWQTVNGFVQLTNGRWTNNSSVAVESATLECDQYDAAGNELDQMRTTVNGPVQPGGTDTFDPFSMGAVANNLNKVTCKILYAKPVGQ